jgi:drug/metabolite transporter (DMT)-like permease
VSEARPTTTGRAVLLILLAAAAFGSISTLVLVATRGGTPLATVLAARYLLAAVLLLIAAGGLRAIRLPRRHAIRATLLGGGGQLAVAGASLASLRYISAGVLAFLFYTYPAWITIIAAVRGTERLTTTRVVALLLSLGGVAVTIGAPGTGGIHPLGVALALGSALAYALYVPFIDTLQRGTTATVASTYICFGAGLLFGAFALVTGVGPLPAPAGMAAIGVLALFCTLVAFLAFLRGLAVLGPVRSAILSTVEPFWTALLGAAVLGQSITRPTLLGGAMIGVAVVVLQTKGAGRVKSG